MRWCLCRNRIDDALFRFRVVGVGGRAERTNFSLTTRVVIYDIDIRCRAFV